MAGSFSVSVRGGGRRMTKPEDWGPAIAAGCAAVGVKLLDVLGGWWKGRNDGELTRRQADREDVRNVERYLRERLDALETKYAALNDRYLETRAENVTLKSQNAELVLQMAELALKVEHGADRQARAERERDDLREQMDELARRVNLGGPA